MYFYKVIVVIVVLIWVCPGKMDGFCDGRKAANSAWRKSEQSIVVFWLMGDDLEHVPVFDNFAILDSEHIVKGVGIAVNPAFALAHHEIAFSFVG